MFIGAELRILLIQRKPQLFECWPEERKFYIYQIVVYALSLRSLAFGFSESAKPYSICYYARLRCNGIIGWSCPFGACIEHSWSISLKS